MNTIKIGIFTTNLKVLEKTIFLAQSVVRIQSINYGVQPLLLSYSLSRRIELNSFIKPFAHFEKHQSFLKIHRKDRMHRADQVRHRDEIVLRKLENRGGALPQLTCH